MTAAIIAIILLSISNVILALVAGIAIGSRRSEPERVQNEIKPVTDHVQPVPVPSVPEPRSGTLEIVKKRPTGSSVMRYPKPEEIQKRVDDQALNAQLDSIVNRKQIIVWPK